MGFGGRLITPEDVYGKDHFKKTWGDFYPNTPIFGGMWDALIQDENGKVEYVVEIKTVQVDGRSGSLEERWKDGEAPHYQALQASLYAYLLGVDKVLMVAVALEDKKGDYEHPEQVTPSYANGNVYIDEFRVSERYPNFDMYIEKATAWWNAYVLTGSSPGFDEKKDGEILKALRTNAVEKTDTSIIELLGKAEQLKTEIEEVTATLDEKQKTLKSILEQIKKYALTQFRDGDTKVSIKGNRYEWVLSKSNSTELDKDALAEDGLLEKYTKIKTSYRLTTSEIKED
jgi:predicted phage-related endonuclease